MGGSSSSSILHVQLGRGASGESPQEDRATTRIPNDVPAGSHPLARPELSQLLLTNRQQELLLHYLLEKGYAAAMALAKIGRGRAMGPVLEITPRSADPESRG